VTLDPGKLKKALQKIFEDAAQSGQAPPQEDALIDQWASAMDSYAGDVLPSSSPIPPTGPKTAMTAALAGFSQANKATTKLEDAFAAYAAPLAVGMVDVTTYSAATAPAGSIGFEQVFASTYSSAADAAQAIADKVQAWMITGSATPTAGGSTPWS
jgi:hypothetical protein